LTLQLERQNRVALVTAALTIVIIVVSSICVLTAEPVKVGFSMALTGSYAGNGRAALLAIQMWADEQNAGGGLRGRPVELVYYDDQSNPAQVPGIYTKLLDVDHVDLVLSGYGTNVIAAAMPVVMQRNMVLMSFFGLAVNDQFRYDRYFQIQPYGPNARVAFSQGFFDVAMTMEPKPKTLAIVATDSEFPKTASEGARNWAKNYDLKIVYDRSFPPSTVDFAPIIRAVQASNPDIVYIACFPPDTVGIARSITELGLRTKLIGGGMVGPQYAAVKQQLGPLLNGFLSFEVYVPEPTMSFPGLREFLDKYQPKAAVAGVDPLGYYLPPFVYAAMQIVGDAVKATQGFDQKAIADYMHKSTHHTVVGDIRFDADGEWAEGRILQVQYQGINGNDLDQFTRPGRQVILFPAQYKSGTLQSPFSEIKR
jgi:branched-chain amino acid transport system substrate-binding protein